ncbi:hypothetical protein [Pandoraea commovens]|uniref:Uncharacterized protein n=1 Tax=Pandoraea commovens TaxID=2508289 RepID=A0A5E4VUP4_9BURK|nr:hypothetical protein [Pandoraea commovens]UVA81379.1 hypothetical protein NTU39_10390 [Pandoraea commovens]VVE16108.1 hypothetical protein PCO31010_02905 [Pandoraea commovens]
MRAIQNKCWSRILRAVSMFVVGAWLLTAYQGVASAVDLAPDGPVQITGAAAISMMQGVPQHDHALPTITMWQKNADKPCSFSLYDGQQINFKDNSACPNDEHYYFSISGAHEGMWLEIQNNPDCGNNESYAFYKVSFQDQQVGDIGQTVVQLSQQKDVGTRLLDGNGKPYLLADGWRGSNPLPGAVSCVKVGQLLPDGPLQFRSKKFPNECLGFRGFDTVRVGTRNCDDSDIQHMLYFLSLSSGGGIPYATWRTRTKDFIPAIYKDSAGSASILYSGVSNQMPRYGEDGRFRVGDECLYVITLGYTAFRKCQGTIDEVFDKVRYTKGVPK